jgi:indole-3-glycerol phosphate synthase
VILDDILAAKVEEVAAAKVRATVDELRARPLYSEPRRGFIQALRDQQGRAIIAEIKKASPSKGVIRTDFDPQAHARSYEQAGACCISVLTDERWFQGSLAFLEQVRAVTTVPLLRKDFTVDPYQIIEARASGADAILLIVAALDDERLRSLAAVARGEGLDVLVEVHTADELKTALAAEVDLIGVNNRDLRTFETSINTTRVLAAVVPETVTLISESGFKHPHELGQLEAIGIDGFLIGESFMREADPGQALSFFLGR